ncbi:CYB5RL family protein [Megaselia abdita]
MITESDCCGNGCTNCILDTKPLQEEDDNRPNALSIYRKYNIVKILDLKPNITKYTFQLTENCDNLSLRIPPGHHIMMRSTELLIRPYSPFSVTTADFEFEILVNDCPNGEMTKYIKGLNLGDSVEFRGPVGKYQHKVNRNVVIFTHGVAIASVFRIVTSILENQEDDSRIYFNACFQDLEHILFRNEIHSWNQFWNFDGLIYLSKGGQDFKDKLKYKEAVLNRRLLEEDIERTILKVKAIGDFEVVLSGSKGFENFIVNSIGNSVDKDQINVL